MWHIWITSTFFVCLSHFLKLRKVTIWVFLFFFNPNAISILVEIIFFIAP